MRAVIAREHGFVDSTENSGGPARYVRLARHPATRIGFISPNSHNFCGSCNRVRMTVEGQLLLCLGQEQAVDFRGCCAAIRWTMGRWSRRWFVG